MTTRRSTKEAFSPGTSIDAPRLDRALEDVVTRFDAIEPGDQERHHTQHQIVMGWMPSRGTQPCFPFLPIYNSDLTCNDVPDEGFQNPWRVKGTRNADIDPTRINGGSQWAWTTAMTFPKPVTLDGVSLFMLTDTEYQNTFQYEAPDPPPSRSAGDPIDDIVLEVSIDNPFLSEVRTQNAVEFHQTKFKVTGRLFSDQALPAFTDMQPNHPGGGPVGVAIDFQGLNIPLPRDARVRFSIVIPEYLNYTSGWQTTSEFPWERQVHSATLTFHDPQEA